MTDIKNTLFEIADKKLTLNRYPLVQNDPFFAWNGAEKYIAEHLLDQNRSLGNILVVEEQFGALSLALLLFERASHIYFVKDSKLSHQGLLQNLDLNGLDRSKITLLSPFDAIPADIDTVVVFTPKNRVYLEYLCQKVNSSVPDGTPIYFGSMVKYLTINIYQFVSAQFAEFHSSLAKYKAKIFSAKSVKKDSFSSLKKSYVYDNLQFVNYPNLFSYQGLDIGTEYFLKNFLSLFRPNENVLGNELKILDLAAGNGVMGISVLKALLNNNSDLSVRLFLSDIAFSALKSQEENVLNSGLKELVTMTIDNSATAFSADFFDIVICNPPFHDQHKVTIDTALELFLDVARVLKPDGTFLLVVNSHLGYQVTLSRYFSKVTIVRQSSKFMILQCQK